MYERKHRRSHKNSRDGCPNCKARRIKCPENLPSCSNCVKKNNRCGYLDFPKEKLEYIRRKKSMEQEHAEATSTEPYIPHQYRDTDHQGALLGQYGHMGSMRVPNGVSNMDPTGGGYHAGTDDSISNQYMFTSGNGNINNLAGPVSYSNSSVSEGVPRSVSSSESGILPTNNGNNNSRTSTSISSLNDNNEGYFAPNMSRSLSGHQLATQTQTFPDYNRQQESRYDMANLPTESSPPMQQYFNGSNPQHDQYRFQVYRELFHDFNPEYCEVTFPETTKNNTSHIDLSTADNLTIFNTASSTNDSASNASSTSATTLSPALNTSQITPVMVSPKEQPDYNVIAERTPEMPRPKMKKRHHKNRMLPQSQIGDFKFCKSKAHPLETQLDRPVHLIPHIPVWKSESIGKFVFDFLLKARTIKLYYLYAIDRSTSTLVRGMEEKFHFEKSRYSEKDLKILRNKGYVIYGSLINYLRRSILKMTLQYPLKVSFLATYSSLGQRQSSMLTYQLMQTGTMALIDRQLESIQFTEEISGNVFRLVSTIMGMGGCCGIPDYNIDILRSLAKDLKIFRSRVDNLIDNGYPLSPLDRGILGRDCALLDAFLDRFFHESYPAIHSINEKYKREFGIDDPSPNIYFTSPSLLFDIASEWLDSSLAIFNRSFGSNILKIITFLFHAAVGRSISNCITPIWSVLLLDFMNIFCLVDNLSKELLKTFLGQMNQEHYPSLVSKDENEHYVMSLFRKLMRVDQFMNSRIIIYRIHLCDNIIPRVPYLRLITRQSENSVPRYGDVIGISASKLSLGEVMVSDLGPNDRITERNLPTAPNEGLARPNEWPQVKDEIVKKEKSEDHFNYSEGLYSDDFNPRPWIEHSHLQSSVQYSLSLEELKARAKVFQISREAVTNVLH